MTRRRYRVTGATPERNTTSPERGETAWLLNGAERGCRAGRNRALNEQKHTLRAECVVGAIIEARQHEGVDRARSAGGVWRGRALGARAGRGGGQFGGVPGLDTEL